MKQIQTTKFENQPVHPNVKPIRTYDDLYPEDPEEREAYWDFINWFMSQEHLLLLNIPKSDCLNDFWTRDIDECGNDVSAFNTQDFRRLHPASFDMDRYKCEKVYEKVKDLALLHSSVSYQQGKENIKKRFIRLVEKAFKDKAHMFVEIHHRYPGRLKKDDLIKKVKELNTKIRECKSIWNENSCMA